jgi:hypothetical protein
MVLLEFSNQDVFAILELLTLLFEFLIQLLVHFIPMCFLTTQLLIFLSLQTNYLFLNLSLSLFNR